MLNTVLFDMGGTLEDIWNNQETQAKAMDALQKTLRAHGLEPGCSPEEFDRRVMAGLKEYKRWSEGLELEKKPEGSCTVDGGMGRKGSPHHTQYRGIGL